MTSRPKYCHWCHETIDALHLTVSQLEEEPPGVSDWRLCSWECAESLARRMASTARAVG